MKNREIMISYSKIPINSKFSPSITELPFVVMETDFFKNLAGILLSQILKDIKVSMPHARFF